MRWNYRHKTPSNIMEALIDTAFGQRFAYSDRIPGGAYSRVKYNDTTPEYLRVGHLVTSLPEDQRKVLEMLVADHINHRPDAVSFGVQPRRRSARWALEKEDKKDAHANRNTW